MRKFAKLPRFSFLGWAKALSKQRFQAPTMHLLQAGSVLLLAALLSSCATDPKVLASPQVLLQSLRIAPDSKQQTHGDARILLHNFSNIPMTFIAMRGEFRLAGQFAAPITLDFSLEIPAESPENVAAQLVLSPAALVFLSASQPIPYTLEGTITTVKPGRTFKFYYEGQLNPTPGIVGAWR